ncbi:MAG: hypothetical protein WBR18_09830 [Anaerolineales bacterium]
MNRIIKRSVTGTDRGSFARRRSAPLALAALALVALACTCSNLFNPAQLLRAALPDEAEQAMGEIEGTLQAVSTPPTPGPSGGVPLPDLLTSGRLNLVSVRGTAEEETMGRILTVQVTNNESGELVAEVPCGLVFNPDDAGEQRMMVVQPASGDVPAGGSLALTPYVVCIDPDQGAPDTASTFTVGTMASGDLFKLAACICEEPLEAELSLDSSMQQLGVQMAVWSVATGDSPSALMERDLGGAAGDALGEQGAEFLGNMMDMLMGPANAWLERCDVQVEGE